MNLRAGSVVLVLALLANFTNTGGAQDTTVARVGLSFDTTRFQPYRRVYDMIVHTRDSAVTIGQREVALSQAIYAGNPAWLLVETRTGVVAAVESLYVSSAMRPLHWYSVQGSARLGATFVGDTVFGAVSAPAGRQSLIIGARPNLIVSQAMTEAMMTLIPLTANWSDSAGVLAVDIAGGSVIPAELAVIAEEQVIVDSATSRPTWVVALRAESRNVFLWVDRETREIHRVQQALPPHVGLLLEYRRRVDIAPALH